MNDVRLVPIDDGVDAGVGQREVVLDDDDLLLPLDVEGSLEVTAGQGLDGDLHVAALDVDQKVPVLDGSSLLDKN